MRKPLSLYIHIPFCIKKCNYCAFTSVVAGESEKNEYVDSLISEIKHRAKMFSGEYEVQSIYIGGGTPSVLDNGRVAEILSTIYMNFVVNNNAEITIEVNPSSLTQEKAKEYYNAGITRVSMGLQAAQEKHLKTLGRLHSKETFAAAVKMLKSAGISNINGDVILGIPNQTEKDVLNTIEFLLTQKVTHVSIYMLEIEEGTKFKQLYDQNLLPLPTDSETIKLYNAAKTGLEKLGFNRYEVSNFAKNGFESRHNQVYWDRGEYLGFGASAHSFVNGERFANTANIMAYISHLKKNEIPLEYKDKITQEEAQEETIMLSLRTTKGLNLNNFCKQFGKNFLVDKRDVVAKLVEDGFLSADADYSTLFVTDKGFMVLNKIIEMLI